MTGDEPAASFTAVRVRGPRHDIETELLRRRLPGAHGDAPPLAAWLALDADSGATIGVAALTARGRIALRVFAEPVHPAVTALATAALERARGDGLTSVRMTRPESAGGARHAALAELGFRTVERIERVVLDVRAAERHLRRLLARHGARPERARRYTVRALGTATPAERSELERMLLEGFGPRMERNARDLARGGVRYDPELSQFATAGHAVHAALLLRRVHGTWSVDVWVAPRGRRGTRAHPPLLARAVAVALERGVHEVAWTFSRTRHPHTAALAARLGARPLPPRCVLGYAISGALRGAAD